MDTMPQRESSAVELLLRRFGYNRPFHIKELSDDDILGLRETLLEYFARTNISIRSRIGKKLNQMSRRSFELGGGRKVAIEIVSKAYKRPALYRLIRL